MTRNPKLIGKQMRARQLLTHLIRKEEAKRNGTVLPKRVKKVKIYKPYRIVQFQAQYDKLMTKLRGLPEGDERVALGKRIQIISKKLGK